LKFCCLPLQNIWCQ